MVETVLKSAAGRASFEMCLCLYNQKLCENFRNFIFYSDMNTIGAMVTDINGPRHYRPISTLVY